MGDEKRKELKENLKKQIDAMSDEELDQIAGGASGTSVGGLTKVYGLLAPDGWDEGYACKVTKSYMDRYGIKPGDSLRIWSKGGWLTNFRVLDDYYDGAYGGDILVYWPKDDTYAKHFNYPGNSVFFMNSCMPMIWFK